MSDGEGKVYEFQALTDIWTGSVKKIKEKTDYNGEFLKLVYQDDSSKLINTGLLGSIRWWFEVLVRGLGGYACDPSKTNCEGTKHCVVCELFGCTGWARKFKFAVLDKDGNIKSNQIKANEIFSILLTEMRFINDEEYDLLDATMRLISEFGAIGGKTVLKPSDTQHQTVENHKDYGLIKFCNKKSLYSLGKIIEHMYKYKNDKTNKIDKMSWASLNNIWFVEGYYLKRNNENESSFNFILGRDEREGIKQIKGKRKIRFSDFLVNNDKISEWLAGQPQHSKKVFSFKNPARTFGFVKNDYEYEFSFIRNKLEQVWKDNNFNFIKRDYIINHIFSSNGEL